MLTLTSPTGALNAIAGCFAKTKRCRVQAREDNAFSPGHFLDLGEIVLPASVEAPDDIERALRLGEYEWTVPDLNAARTGLHLAISGKPDAPSDTRLR